MQAMKPKYAMLRTSEPLTFRGAAVVDHKGKYGARRFRPEYRIPTKSLVLSNFFRRSSNSKTSRLFASPWDLHGFDQECWWWRQWWWGWYVLGDNDDDHYGDGVCLVACKAKTNTNKRYLFKNTKKLRFFIGFHRHRSSETRDPDNFCLCHNFFCWIKPNAVWAATLLTGRTNSRGCFRCGFQCLMQDLHPPR